MKNIFILTITKHFGGGGGGAMIGFGAVFPAGAGNSTARRCFRGAGLIRDAREGKIQIGTTAARVHRTRRVFNQWHEFQMAFINFAYGRNTGDVAGKTVDTRENFRTAAEKKRKRTNVHRFVSICGRDPNVTEFDPNCVWRPPDGVQLSF